MYVANLHTMPIARRNHTLRAIRTIKPVNAIDIDGTLNEDMGYKNYEIAPPKRDVIEKVQALDGFKIGYTARSESDREVTENWMRLHGIELDAIIFDKMPFTKLIDDRVQHVDRFMENPSV